MRAIIAGSLSLFLTAPAMAQTALKPALAPLGFLVGNWDSGEGKVADTGGTSKGGSIFTVESDGAAILRRDHTELFDKAGKPAGGFHQTMLIYAEGEKLKADYVDGEGHAIHYTGITVTAGKAVTFMGITQADRQGPTFKLTYEMKGPDMLLVNFGMTAPGGSEFRPIATGTLKRAQ